jgi:glycosyltransferase involved in cell wall biosynthesis
MDKKISVIIPCYNRAATIGRCLDSILVQSYNNLEIIIVDDGSTDNIDGAIKPYLDRIKFIKQANQGAPAARNVGFANSRGELVIFCDCDIIMKPQCLQKMAATLEKNQDAAFAYCSFRFGWKKFRLYPFTIKRLKQMPFITTTSLIRRECFPGFDVALRKFQDWDLWLTIWEKYGRGGVWIDEVLFRAITGGTMSNWLPSFIYKLPFIKNKNVEKYKAAMEIIKKKHNP